VKRKAKKVSAARRAAPLSVEPIATAVFRAEDDLVDFIVQHLPGGAKSLRGRVLAITSKIVSLDEGCVVPRAETTKLALVKREADQFLGELAHGVSLTIKHGLFIPSAGIDESNSEDDAFITFPKDPYASAKRIHAGLKARLKLGNEFGVLITDSHTHPLRRGVTGITLSYWGFKATRKLIGQKDLFGRKLTMTYVAVADALSTAAVFMMGEAAERSPLALVSAPGIEFSSTGNPSDLAMPVKEDLYLPLYRHLLSRSP
jgi:dihydrofolate synthase / folylpolyglutamate synthase